MNKTQKTVNPSKIVKKLDNKYDYYNLKMSGSDIIKYIAKSFPSKPGVYQMENNEGQILYIGKAKNLRKRVISYSNISSLTRRLQRMVTQTKSVNFTITNSEIEALLLECNLIKKHKPKFNIILRDDKSFPFVLINKEHYFPRIQKYRGPKKIKGDYYGPFVSPSVADYTLVSLQKTFLLRSCSDSYFSNRSRACLLYDIKRCSAPCVKKISEKNYRESINDAKKFLSGNTKGIEKKLQKLMERASLNQAYEEAIRLRDRIKSLKQIQKYQSAYIHDLRNIDIFGIKILDGRSCIYGMFYRNGSNYGNKAFFPYHDDSSNSFEILESFMFQFYANKEAPAKILINIDSIYFKNFEHLIGNKNNKKIRIINPKKGEKFKHVKLAEKNAIENIKSKNSSLKNHYKSLLDLKKLLELNQLPQRIEAYDNSHIFGNQSLGVMIVVNQEGFVNSSYRKFNIKYNQNNLNIKKSNDYYMLEEVLKRRFIRINEENEWSSPDVIIIDGGKGHLNIAKKIIKNNNKKNIHLIAMAKGKERNKGREIIYYNDKLKILKENDSLLNFLQRIRDESHRFAINSHRKRRNKEAVKSVFDEIIGIGNKRKKILIDHFGNIEKIRCAKINELYKVKGINKKIAEKIYGFFNGQ